MEEGKLGVIGVRGPDISTVTEDSPFTEGTIYRAGQLGTKLQFTNRLFRLAFLLLLKSIVGIGILWDSR